MKRSRVKATRSKAKGREMGEVFGEQLDKCILVMWVEHLKQGKEHLRTLHLIQREGGLMRGKTSF